MPTWPSPRSERLGTPKIPAIRFTRGTYFGASRFTYATACQVARPPLTDRTRSPRSQRAFTSRLPAVWSPSLPLDITTTWTGLLLLAGLAPARMAASLAAPDPDGTNDLQARSTYQPTLHKYPHKRYILFAGHHALQNQGENLLPGGTRLPSLNPLTGPGRGFRAGLRRPEGLGEEPIAGCQCRCAVQWKSMLF